MSLNEIIIIESGRVNHPYLDRPIVNIGDRVRVVGFGRKVEAEGVLEEAKVDPDNFMAYGGGYIYYKIGGKWYSDFWTIEKVSEESMGDKIKVGDRVRLTLKGEKQADGLLEEVHIHTKEYKVDGRWYSEFCDIEKVSGVKKKKKFTTIDEDLMNALIS